MSGWTFLGGMDIKDLPDLVSQFCYSPADFDGSRGVCYSSEPDYSVDMRAIWRDKSGRFWELNTGHCSCYGYEEHGPPSEVTADYVKTQSENKNLNSEWQTALAALVG